MDMYIIAGEGSKVTRMEDDSETESNMCSLPW